jgi:hypothetical protein
MKLPSSLISVKEHSVHVGTFYFIINNNININNNNNNNISSSSIEPAAIGGWITKLTPSRLNLSFIIFKERARTEQ